MGCSASCCALLCFHFSFNESQVSVSKKRLILCSQLQVDAIDIEQAAKVAVCLIKHLNHLVNLLLLLMIVGTFIGLGKQAC